MTTDSVAVIAAVFMLLIRKCTYWNRWTGCHHVLWRRMWRYQGDRCPCRIHARDRPAKGLDTIK